MDRHKRITPLIRENQTTSSWSFRKLFHFCLQLQDQFYHYATNLHGSGEILDAADNEGMPSPAQSRRRSITQLYQLSAWESMTRPDDVNPADIHDISQVGKIEKEKTLTAVDTPFVSSQYGYPFHKKLNEGVVFIVAKMAGLLNQTTAWKTLRQLYCRHAKTNLLEASLQHLHWTFIGLSSSQEGTVSAEDCSRMVRKRWTRVGTIGYKENYAITDSLY